MLREAIRTLEVVQAASGDSCSICERELDAGQLVIEGPASTLFCSLGCADRIISYPLEEAELWRVMV